MLFKDQLDQSKATCSFNLYTEMCEALYSIQYDVYSILLLKQYIER